MLLKVELNYIFVNGNIFEIFKLDSTKFDV